MREHITILKDNGEVEHKEQEWTPSERTHEFDQAVYDSLAYARARRVEYDLLNQDEMRFDDLVNSTTTWRDAILAIKAAHPKP